MALEGRAALGELRDNELAVSTMAVVDRVRPHVGIILLAIAVVFAVFAGMVLVRSQQAAERAAGWEACLGALSDGEPGRLEEVAARYRGAPAGWWAELVMADAALADGNRLLVTDRAQAEKRLAAAADLYTSVNAQRPTALAAERGVFGLARTRESQGQLKEALRGYKALAAEYPASPFTAIAKGRLTALALPATQRWYKWFETPPAAPAAPSAEPSDDKPAESAEPATPTKPAADERAGEPSADKPPAATPAG
jgi:hypothetical protein